MGRFGMKVNVWLGCSPHPRNQVRRGNSQEAQPALAKGLLEEVVYLQLQQDIFTDWAASSGLVLTSQGHATRMK